MGFRADFSPQEIADIRAMDSFFLQAAASENDTFLYFSGKFLPFLPRNYVIGHPYLSYLPFLFSRLFRLFKFLPPLQLTNHT